MTDLWTTLVSAVIGRCQQQRRAKLKHRKSGSEIVSIVSVLFMLYVFDMMSLALLSFVVNTTVPAHFSTSERSTTLRVHGERHIFMFAIVAYPFP